MRGKWVVVVLAVCVAVVGCRRGGNPALRLSEQELKTYLEVWPGYHSRMNGPNPNPAEAGKYVQSKGLQVHQLLAIGEKFNLSVSVAATRELARNAKTDQERNAARAMLAVATLVRVPKENVALVLKHKTEIEAMFKAMNQPSPFALPPKPPGS
jgi:hypothetical protein